MSKLDTKQVELIATSWLEFQLMKNGFEVARPLRDKEIDLIAYTDNPDCEFSAHPIQIKSARNKTFSLDKKYRDRSIVMAYIWGATTDRPELFLVPFSKALNLLSLIGDAPTSDSWALKGQYSTQRPSKKLTKKLELFRDCFDVLKR